MLLLLIFTLSFLLSPLASAQANPSSSNAIIPIIATVPVPQPDNMPNSTSPFSFLPYFASPNTSLTPALSFTKHQR